MCFDSWLETGQQSYTQNGHPRAAPLDTVLEWICAAWEKVSSELVKKSFKTCGVTNAADGSEDDQIHCFKSNGELYNGLDTLKNSFSTDNSGGCLPSPVTSTVQEEECDQSDSEAESVIELDASESVVISKYESDMTA